MKKLALIMLVLLLSLPVMAAEQLDLTTPYSCANYRVDKLFLDWSGETIFIVLLCPSTGERREFVYSGSIARTFMIALNKANLSTNSLQKRIFDRLVTDGKLAGTVSGSPD